MIGFGESNLDELLLILLGKRSFYNTPSGAVKSKNCHS